MRSCLLLPFLLVPVLAAQGIFQGDAAEARIASVKASQDPAIPAFIWLRPKDQRFSGAWELDPDYSRVVIDREFIGADFEDGEAQAWAARLGWKLGPHWLLLSPEGEPLLSGTESPDPARLLDAMRGTGWRSRFELRDQFLREHPDNGDAWGEAEYDAARFASHRAVVEHRLRAPDPRADQGLELDDMDKRPTPPDQDQAQWGPAVFALNGLLGVEGWSDQQDLFFGVTALRVGGVKNSALMRDPLRRLRQGTEAALRRHPSDYMLWAAWNALWELSPDSDPQALLQSLDGAPRQPWPPLASADSVGEAFVAKQDWTGLESIASQAYAQAMDPLVRLYQGDGFVERMISSWGFWRVLALAKQRREVEAQGVVKELRSLSGSRWPVYADTRFAPSLEFYLGKEDALVKSLWAARGEKTPPDPPKLAPPLALHLALVGHPAWERDWNGYATQSAFDAWEPSEEVSWVPLKPQDERALRARLGWGSEPHWILLRGDGLLASSTALPTPAFLADRLRAEGLPYLEQLDAFIRTHPDHLEAREARMELLRRRMPNERLEATLLDDARATLKPFLQSEQAHLPVAWTPRKELWEPVARRMVPELEARLQRWPERVELWEAWLDWAEASKQRPSPTRFMQGLSIWKTRIRGGAGPLRDQVLAAVSKHLTDEARWQDLAEWCQAFWEGGVRDELARLALPLPVGGRRDRERRGEQVELYTRALLAPYRLALEKLGRDAQLRTFLEEVKTVDPTIAKKLTASATPPPRAR